MEDIKQVKLNIWGIRGGYRSFCHSEDLLVEDPEILNTWKDIRDFVYVADLNVRFYALEFTPHYKVFTMYRPVNDTSRTGAYVATTIYVPHALKVLHMLDLLKQISDAYHKDHYDAFGNPNTNPDYIQVYNEILKGFGNNLVREDMTRSWNSSAQDNIPRVLPFSNLGVVERFFEAPYRLEFLNHQEVMFWDAAYITQPSPSVKFQKPEILGSAFPLDGIGISEQFQGSVIRGDVPAGVQLVSFKRDGVDVTQNWKSCRFQENTSVEIELKKAFCEPFKYSGLVSGVGSCPFVKQGLDFVFKSMIDFIPRTYQVHITTPEVNKGSFELLFDQQPVKITDGVGILSFKVAQTTQLNQLCKVSLRNGNFVKEVTSFPWSLLFTSGGENPEESYAVKGLKQFRFHFDRPCNGQIACDSSLSAISFTTAVGKNFDVVLPKNTIFSKVSVTGYDTKMTGTDPIVVELMEKASGYVPPKGNQPGPTKPNYGGGHPAGGHSSGNSGGGRSQESWFSEHKGLVLSIGVALTLLVVGLVIWLAVGKGSKGPVYVINVNTNHDTKIEKIDFYKIVPADAAKYLPEGKIELYKGWKSVEFVVVTEGEGKCEPITVDYQENRESKLTSNNSDWFTCSINTSERMTLRITSPDWVELERFCQNNNNSSSLALYASRAESSNSSNIKSEYVQRAVKLVEENNYDKEYLSAFVDYFKKLDSDLAKAEVNRFKNMKEKMEDDEKQQEEMEAKQNALEDFETKFNKVYSTECTLNAISALKTAYGKVEEYDERFDIITKIIGVSIKSADWFNSIFIPTQKEFFSIFEETYSNAKTKINGYLSRKNDRYLLFSEGQRTQMNKLLDDKVFLVLKDDRPNITSNWAIYNYIKKETK